jgi:hypothetical protein
MGLCLEDTNASCFDVCQPGRLWHGNFAKRILRPSVLVMPCSAAFVWVIRWIGPKSESRARIATVTSGLSAFGLTPNRDPVLGCDTTEGGSSRIRYAGVALEHQGR